MREENHKDFIFFSGGLLMSWSFPLSKKKKKKDLKLTIYKDGYEYYQEYNQSRKEDSKSRETEKTWNCTPFSP